jgi:23S rRNA-/tRNA-specific pseudouridylate synthase
LTATEEEGGGHWFIPVLWEDEHLLVLDKPSDLAVRPVSDDAACPALLPLLRRGIEQGLPWAVERALGFLDTPQRPDTESSGVVVFTRSKAHWQELANQFASHDAPESILTLVEGAPESSFVINAPMARRPAPEGYYRLDARRGRKAETSCAVVEQFRGYAMLRCAPVGGRPHQIRAHLRRRGLRVVGDGLYGGRPLLLSRLKPGYRFKRDQEERPLMGRPALHVERVKFLHPVCREVRELVAPWPKDFEISLKYLRRYAG